MCIVGDRAISDTAPSRLCLHAYRASLVVVWVLDLGDTIHILVGIANFSVMFVIKPMVPQNGGGFVVQRKNIFNSTYLLLPLLQCRRGSGENEGFL